MLATYVGGGTFNYTGGTNTQTTLNNNDSDVYAVNSWNFGKMVVSGYNPSAYIDNGCYFNSTVSASSCQYLTSVGSGWLGTYTATTSSSKLITYSGTTYDPHYLVGNYYDWYVATADGEPGSASICPAGGAAGANQGWRLPTISQFDSSIKMPYAGNVADWNGATLDDVGKNAVYITSDMTGMWPDYYVTSNDYHSGSGPPSAIGASVRCLYLGR